MEWQVHFSPLNATACPAAGVRSSQQKYFTYSCGCIGLKQIATLRRRPDSALRCLEHGEGARRPSTLVLQVREMLLRTTPGPGPVVLEACLLPKNSKKFDFWLPKWGIAGEVDGRQHFVGGMHDASAAAQQAQDKRIDKLCKKHRLRLLRFHHEDDKQWASLLQRAIHQVQRNPHCWFIERTASYAYDGAA